MCSGNTNRADEPCDEPLIEEMHALPDEAFRRPEWSDAFKEAVFRRSVGTMHRRVVRRRVALTALVAAAYISGIGTAYYLPRRVAPTVTEPTTNVRVATAPERMEALVLRAAQAPPEERGRLLCRAGDIALSEAGNIETALHYYAEALDCMPSSRAEVGDPEDSWLLLALKQSRWQERL
jgi:hypothetical protein